MKVASTILTNPNHTSCSTRGENKRKTFLRPSFETGWSMYIRALKYSRCTLLLLLHYMQYSFKEAFLQNSIPLTPYLYYIQYSYHTSTQCHSATFPQCHSITLAHSATVPKCHSPQYSTVVLVSYCHSATIPQCHSTTHYSVVSSELHSSGALSSLLVHCPLSFPCERVSSKIHWKSTAFHQNSFQTSASLL